MQHTYSDKLFAQAQKTIPAGVNSPARAFSSVTYNPIFIDHGKGAYLYDVDGNAYIDYVGSWGPLILGHTHPEVMTALKEAMNKGLSFGAPTTLEVQLAEKITQLIPSIEKIRMVNSGTEATMSAIRLARGFTGRNKIIKFEGCYHGHVDSLLVKAGSAALTHGQPSSAGVTPGAADDTLVAQFNDLTSVEELFEKNSGEIAAIIVEPVAGNMNCISPKSEFLQGLRKLCDQHDSVLIFDEVMCGFRASLGGAQVKYGVTPDLTTLGKIIGGGMPVGAFGGRADILDHIAPDGPVYQAGTLSGNPVAMAAGLKTLELLEQNGFHETLSKRTETLLTGLEKAAQAHDIPFTTNQEGCMFGLFFTEKDQVTSFAEATECNLEHFKQFFAVMLEEGIYLAPSAFEAGFMSSAHTADEIERTVEAADKAFQSINQ